MSEEQQTNQQHNYVGNFDTGAFTAQAPKADQPAVAGDAAVPAATTSSATTTEAKHKSEPQGLGETVTGFFHDLGAAFSSANEPKEGGNQQDVDSESSDDEGVNHKFKGFIQQVADDFTDLLRPDDSKLKNHPKTGEAKNENTDEQPFAEQIKPQREDAKSDDSDENEGINKKFQHFCDDLSDDIHKLVSSDDSKKKDDETVTTTEEAKTE